VYLALQQGVVDGQENPVSTIETQKFFEVQKYMTLTSHIMSFQQFFVSESFYSTLPEDLKAIVDEAAVNMKKLNDSIIVDAENTTTDRLRENGLTVVELTDEGRQAFSSLIIPVITKQYAPEWDGFYEKIIEAQQ
jgi:C4-dicarboxylate-binding protein DctP